MRSQSSCTSPLNDCVKAGAVVVLKNLPHLSGLPDRLGIVLRTNAEGEALVLMGMDRLVLCTGDLLVMDEEGYLH